MKNTAIGLVAAVVACSIATACCAGETPDPKPQTVTVRGVVSATFDEDWNPTLVTVKDTSKQPAVTYVVVLDAKGTSLANQLEGAEAEIVALLTEDNAKKTKTLKVTSFKAVPAAEEPEPEPADDGDGNENTDDGEW